MTQRWKQPSLQCFLALLSGFYDTVPITVLASSFLLRSCNEHYFFLISCRTHCANLILESIPQTLECTDNIWRPCHKCKFLERPSGNLIDETRTGAWEPEFLPRTPVIWRKMAYKPQLASLFRGCEGRALPSLGSQALRKADTCRAHTTQGMLALRPIISPKLPYHLFLKACWTKAEGSIRALM